MRYTTIPEEWVDSDTVDAVEATRWLMERFPTLVEEQNLDRMEFCAGDPIRYRRIWIRYTLSGDYVGSCVERANLLTLLEECPSIVEESVLDYGSTVGGWELRLDPAGEWVGGVEWDGSDFRALVDALARLAEYPILDEGLWSELEEDARSTAWEEETPYVMRAIAVRASDAVERGYTVDAERLLSDWMEKDVCGWHEDIVIVEGISAYVDVDPLVDCIMEEYGGKLDDYVIPVPWNDPTKPEFHESEAVGKRASLHNARAQAALHREMGLLGAGVGEGNE